LRSMRSSSFMSRGEHYSRCLRGHGSPILLAGASVGKRRGIATTKHTLALATSRTRSQPLMLGCPTAATASWSTKCLQPLLLRYPHLERNGHRVSPRSASRCSLQGKGVQSKEEGLRRGVDSRPPLRQILSRPPHGAKRRFPLLKPSSDALAGQQRRPGSHPCRGIAVETAPGRSSVLQ